MKSLIIGFDAFDPNVFERLAGQGRLPNLGQFIEGGGYSRFEISNPAQSEVSWSSIATGLNPGGHGLFDFVHRNPADYSLHVSLLPTKKQLFGVQFTQPHKADTIFEYAVRQGYPASSLWWPATFPARIGSPVRTIPGLGTPDILGRLGVGTFFSLTTSLSQDEHKTRVERLQGENSGKYKGRLEGPVRKKLTGTTQATIEFLLEIIDDATALLQIGKESVQLQRGVWSPIMPLSFSMGLGVSVHAITRAIYNDHPSGPGLYFLPLQLHPLHSPWPYGTPRNFIRDNWETSGPFLTLGWPQDTTGLEEMFISDDQFLQLCESIIEARGRTFLHQLDQFEEGILAVVFDSLDRIQHMFWRDRGDIIEAWYQKLDSLFGQILSKVNSNKLAGTRIFVVSDHGFSDFSFKVHVNCWLIENGFMAAKDPLHEGKIENIDWMRTQAYSVGLASIYANLAGREGKGIAPKAEMSTLLNNLKGQLLEWRGPDDRKVINAIWTKEEAFTGPLMEYGPDLVLGFNSGYRASAQTGLGGWEAKALEPNPDHWGADHCIDPALVPGVLMANVDLGDSPSISYQDFPELVIGKTMDDFKPPSSEPPEFVDEDEKVLQERLKDLGYL